MRMAMAPGPARWPEHNERVEAEDRDQADRDERNAEIRKASIIGHDFLLLFRHLSGRNANIIRQCFSDTAGGPRCSHSISHRVRALLRRTSRSMKLARISSQGRCRSKTTTCGRRNT